MSSQLGHKSAYRSITSFMTKFSSLTASLWQGVEEILHHIVGGPLRDSFGFPVVIQYPLLDLLFDVTKVES